MSFDMKEVRRGAWVALGVVGVILVLTSPLGIIVSWTFSIALMLTFVSLIMWGLFVVVGYAFTNSADALVGFASLTTLGVVLWVWHNSYPAAAVLLYLPSGIFGGVLSYRHHQRRIQQFIAAKGRPPALRDYLEA